MATWIAHLRIAEELLAKIPQLDAHQFAIGNIAPDSGIPDEHSENFEPPSRITHLLVENEDEEFQYRDFDFYKEFLSSINPFGRETNKFSFLLGYFFHIITDNLWFIKIGRPSRIKYLSKFENKRVFSKEIKKDWYGLDFAYVRNNPDSIYWKIFLNSEYKENFLDFYPNDTIARQEEFLKNFYKRADKEIDENYRIQDNIYLSKDEVDIFVKETVNTLLKIYKILWIEQTEVEVNHSVLEITGV